MATNPPVLDRLGVSQEALAAFCQKWKIAKLELFGSALGEAFGPDSDLDFLYTFDANAHWGFKFVSLRAELENLVGRPVDMASRKTIERSVNYLMRRSILKETVVVYES